MQTTNAQLQGVLLNLPVESLDAIANQPKVPQDLYTPLEDYQTRLLTILPGKGEADLICELTVVDLIHAEGVIIHGTKHRLHYQALSYSWGYLPATVALICNGKLCQISSSLEQALRTVRHAHEKVNLWVDAFCIHQADLNEKAQQIRSIRVIFAKAEKVAIWLRDSEKASQIKRGLDDSAIDLPIVLASCRWFRRSWVRQEVAAARQLVFIPESAGLSFGELCQRAQAPADVDLWMRLHRNPDIDYALCSSSSGDPYAPLLYMIKSRSPPSEFRTTSRLDFYLLLNSCSVFQATNPRDKIYGVLSLLPGYDPGQSFDTIATQDQVLLVDYNKSVAEVYMNMTLHLLLTSQRCDVLDLHTPSVPNTHLLPSWVFDFDSPSSHMLRPAMDYSYHRWSVPTRTGYIRFEHAPDGLRNVIPRSPTLIVPGVIAGTIETINCADGLARWCSTKLDDQWFTHVGGERFKVNEHANVSDTLVYFHNGTVPVVLRPITTAQDDEDLGPGYAGYGSRYYHFLGASLAIDLKDDLYRQRLQTSFDTHSFIESGAQQFHSFPLI